MYDAKCDVTGDPEWMILPSHRGRLELRIELPMIYRFCPCFVWFEAQVTPFYEFVTMEEGKTFLSIYRYQIDDLGFNLLLSYRF